MAQIELLFGCFLLIECKFTTTLDALTTNFKTAVNINYRSLIIIEAMHGAPGTFKVHNVEFFVQVSIKVYLSILHPLIQHIEYFFIHVINGLFVFGNVEEFSYTFMGI